MKEFYNGEELYLWKDKTVGTFSMGGLSDIISQHRSEYFQHDQIKVFNYSEIEYDTPLTHPQVVDGLYS